MDEALRISTGTSVCAEDFFKDEEVDRHDFKCELCGARLTLCSYGAENKKRPYFRAPGGGHTECEYAASSGVGSGSREALHIDPGPREVIERLVFPKAINFEHPRSPDAAKTRNADDSDSQTPFDGPHKRTASSLKPVVQAYLSHPAELANHPLQVPSVSRYRYRDIFCVLSYAAGRRYVESRVYCGALRLSSQPTIGPSWLQLTFTQGGRGPGGPKFQLRVDTSAWTPRLIELLNKKSNG